MRQEGRKRERKGKKEGALENFLAEGKKFEVTLLI